MELIKDYSYTVEIVFYFIFSKTMDKRLIVSKGDGKNYLGYAPDGSIHNMRKIRGAFYRLALKQSWLLAVGDAIPKSEFILQE